MGKHTENPLSAARMTGCPDVARGTPRRGLLGSETERWARGRGHTTAMRGRPGTGNWIFRDSRRAGENITASQMWHLPRRGDSRCPLCFKSLSVTVDI